MAMMRLLLSDSGTSPAMIRRARPFDDGRLADARVADEHGVVFGPAGKHLHDAPDFVVAADHRVDLALAGFFGQVLTVLFERLVFAFRILIR